MKSWQDVDDKTAATMMEYEEEGRAEKRRVAQRKTPHSLPLLRNKRKKEIPCREIEAAGVE